MSLNGLDISKFQDGIDLALIPGDFVIVGTSDGAEALNPLADAQCAAGRKAKKELGLYHYFRNDPAEADRWAEISGKWQDGQTVFALDAEEKHDELPQRALAFCRRFEALTGIKPIIYTYWNLLQLYDWSAVRAAGYELWGAWYPLGNQRIDGYNPPARQSPKYWGEDMRMWQYTSTGHLPGWAGRLDLNIFHGTRTEWRALGKKKAGAMPQYIWPVPRGAGINQVFGASPGGVNPDGGHTGIDFGVKAGTPIYAPADGVIEYAQWFTTDNGSDNPYWITNGGGISVVLGCDGGTSPSFVFSHLDYTEANTGDRVKQGDVIGYSGNTGKWTTGAHLHFEAIPPGFNLNSPTYGRVDPGRYCTGHIDTITGQGSGSITPISPAPIQEDELTMADINKILGFIATVHQRVIDDGDALRKAIADAKAGIKADLATVHTTIIRDVGAQLAGIREAVSQTQSGKDIDWVAVEAAAKRGAEAAIAEGVVKVDVTIAGGDK